MNIADLHAKAESGSAVAQTILGIHFLDGIEVEADYSKAFRFLSAAADQGASRAVLNLARMYAEGRGTPKNMTEAIRLYKAVAKTEFLASIALGRIYSLGHEIPVSHGEAARWYSEALTFENRVGECTEIQEAKTYLANSK